MRDIDRNDLVILDEFGYVPIDVESVRLLFQVVSGCYERRSMIFTTNIEFSKWGTILGDDKLAAAMIDRIVHHGKAHRVRGVEPPHGCGADARESERLTRRVCQTVQIAHATLFIACLT